MPKHVEKEPSGTPLDSAEEVNEVEVDAVEVDKVIDTEDEPIGLTEAFEPVELDPTADEDDSAADRDNSIGLTKAFAPVKKAPGVPAHAGGFSYKGDNEDEYPNAIESLEPHEEPPLLLDEDELPVDADEPVGLHSKDKKEKDAIPPHLRKSRRTRRVLIVAVILLIVLIGALGYFSYRLFAESQTLAAQQAQQQQEAQEVAAIQQEEAKDATTEAVKRTEAPNLAALLGRTQEEAVVALERGATVTSEREVNEEGSAIRRNVTVALTDEPADTRTGTPTVYLGLNEEGAVIQTGYSASTTALGYGSLSFADAVRNEHVVEKTLQEAGIPVPEGAAELPADRASYSTYDTDGTTLVRENCSFSGTVDLNGAPHEWSSVLSYDYTTANMSGNLADTIRIIYVYINA